MAKEIFDQKLRLGNENKQMLNRINDIIEEYRADDYTLTLRQLYYQLVSKDVIPNNDKEYAKLSNILKKGRMAGVVDWSAIEDRIRKPKRPYWVFDIEDALKDTINEYRLNLQKGQSKKVEVWVEKDALSNVIYRITEKYHIPLMVNRGYSSVSAMYDAYKRLDHGDTILYFGDHDPSGMDMVRDIKDRLLEFGLDINVRPIALTMEQINTFNPPPNPAKINDPRADWYIRNFGNESWELDALPPKSLANLVENAILEEIDLETFNNMQKQQEDDIEKLKEMINSLEN